MLDKPLDQITLADLKELLEEKWPEGKAIDYKRDMYGKSDADKKELLKDVSSFANTDGGDLIIGVDEAGGLPVAIPGTTVADIDAKKLRLDQIIRQGIEPRIDFAIHAVDTGSGEIRILLPMASVRDIPTVPGELFAKFQTSFSADPVDAVFKALGVQ